MVYTETLGSVNTLFMQSTPSTARYLLNLKTLNIISVLVLP